MKNWLYVQLFRIKSLFVYLGYKRVFMCVLIAFCFSSSFCAAFYALQYNNVGVDLKQLFPLDGFSSSNPITMISLGATMVTFSLTLLGFSINSFIKYKSPISLEKEGVSKKTCDVQQQTIEILMLRYRGYKNSLLFINLFNFPILSKAFVLVFLLFAMIIQSIVGVPKYTAFFLYCYLFLMVILAFSILFEVFSLCSDRNYNIERAVKIINNKISKRLRYLFTVNKLRINNGELLCNKFVNTNLSSGRYDLILAAFYINEAYKTVKYRSTSFNNCFSLKDKHIKENMGELILCSIGLPETQSDYNEIKESIIEFIRRLYTKYDSLIIRESLKYSMDNVENNYGYLKKCGQEQEYDKIKSVFCEFYAKIIMIGEKYEG